MTPDERIQRLESLVGQLLPDLSRTSGQLAGAEGLIRALIATHPDVPALLTTYRLLAEQQVVHYLNTEIQEEFREGLQEAIAIYERLLEGRAG